MNITFTSTYRIPITQAGINSAKKEKLADLVKGYVNNKVSKQKTGFARVSMENSHDTVFETKLKSIGYRVFQKFDGENINKNSLDDYIKECLKYGEYRQKGKQMPKKNTFLIR